MAVFEHPLNEKIRLFMRLSYLMKRFNYHLEEPSPENCQAAVVVLLELYNLSSRLDVKNAALHVLDFQTQAVRQAEGAHGVDDARASRILAKLEEKSKQLYSFRGQLGQHLKTHSFLNILRQRASIAGGINGLDIPLFNHWLSKSSVKRVEDLRGWARPYEIAFEAIELLMELIYQGGEEQEVTADGGFYQSSLGADRDYQLLSIELPNNSKVYPEISAGKQRFSVRFVDATTLEERGKQIIENVDFKLTLYSY
jgi:cell division protein ZapD